MKRVGRVSSALVLLVLVHTGCEGTDHFRVQAPGLGADTIRIAAVWSWGDQSSRTYAQGIALAVETVNREGGALGRPVVVDRFDDRGSVHEGRLTASEIVRSQKYDVALGHLHSHVSAAAAPVYEAAGLLMLTPASTAPDLTRQGFQRVFRTIQSDLVSAAQLVRYSAEKGYNRIAICYVRTEYGSGFANAFEREAAEAGLTVVDRRSYEPSVADEDRLFDTFAEWIQREADAVLLAGVAPSAGVVLRTMREAGLDVPVFGGDGLDDSRIFDAAGASAAGVTALTVFHADNPRQEVQAFRRRFEARFGAAPDSWSARGFEATQLIAEAMRRAGSASGQAIADALRDAGPWSTLHGPITFDSYGDPSPRPGVLIHVAGGRFEFRDEVPATHQGESTHRATSKQILDDRARELP